MNDNNMFSELTRLNLINISTNLPPDIKKSLATRATNDFYSGIDKGQEIRNSSEGSWRQQNKENYTNTRTLLDRAQAAYGEQKAEYKRIRFEPISNKGDTLLSQRFELIKIILFLTIAIFAEFVTSLQISEVVMLSNPAMAHWLAIAISLINFFGAFFIEDRYNAKRHSIEKQSFRNRLSGVGFLGLFVWLGIFGLSNQDLIYDIGQPSQDLMTAYEFNSSNVQPTASEPYHFMGNQESSTFSIDNTLGIFAWMTQIVITQTGLALALILLFTLLRNRASEDAKLQRESLASRRLDAKKKMQVLAQFCDQVEELLKKLDRASKEYADKALSFYLRVQQNFN